MRKAYYYYEKYFISLEHNYFDHDNLLPCELHNFQSTSTPGYSYCPLAYTCCHASTSHTDNKE